MAFVRLDKLPSSATLVTFAHAEELENGMVVELGRLGSDKDSYVATDVKNVDGRVVLHASVAFDYTETMVDEFHYRLKAGQKGRGIYLTPGTIITVDEAVVASTDAIEIGDIVEPAVGKKLAKVGTRAAKVAMEVIDKESIFGHKCLVLEVLA